MQEQQLVQVDQVTTDTIQTPEQENKAPERYAGIPEEMLNHLVSQTKERINNTAFDPETKQELVRNVETTAEYLNELLKLPNNPENRRGKQKAEWIVETLRAQGLHAEIWATENLDPTHRANENNTWYNVAITIGDQDYDGTGINILHMVHHDTIAKKPHEIMAQLTDNTITHPWVLDDTIHVAATMVEAVRLQKWWDENKQALGLKGRILILITDGEEVNTSGARAVFKQMLQSGTLFPFDATVTGESNGTDGSLTNASSTFRGKDMFEVKDIAKPEKPRNVGKTFRDLMFRTILTQLASWHKSHGNDPEYPPDIISPNETSWVLSNGIITPESMNTHVEARTHPNCNTQDSKRITELCFSNDHPEMLLVLLQRLPETFKPPTLTDEQISDSFNLTYDPDNNTFSVNIDTDKVVHAGGFNPWTTDNGLFFAYFFFNQLHENNDNQLQENLISVDWGESSKPNSMLGTATLKFHSPPDDHEETARLLHTHIESTIKTLIKGKENPEYFHFLVMKKILEQYAQESIGYATQDSLNGKMSLVFTGYKNDTDGTKPFYISMQQQLGDIQWDVKQKPGCPPRDSITSNPLGHFMQSVRGHLQGLFNLANPRKKRKVLINSFNAMCDAGALQEVSIDPDTLTNNRFVNIGCGLFELLHGLERIDPETLLESALQYRGLYGTIIGALIDMDPEIMTRKRQPVLK